MNLRHHPGRNGRHRVFLFSGKDQIALSLAVKIRRGKKSHRQAARECGIMWTVMIRIERGDIPGGANMIKILKWIDVPLRDVHVI